MKATTTSYKLAPKQIVRVFAITIGLLLIPFIAMQLNWHAPDPGSATKDEVNWDIFDFMVMGILIFTTGIAYEILSNKVDTFKQRLIVAATVAGVFFLIWAELAVGIFGSPIAGS